MTLPDLPDHGLRGYFRGCRCEVCRAANAARGAAQVKRKYLGQVAPTQLVSLERAQKWLAYLQSQGMSWQMVMDATGLSQPVLERVSSGVSHKNKSKPARITRGTEAKILATRPTGAYCDTVRVPANLTWQRIHSLVALGYPIGWIAERLGKQGNNRQIVVGKKQVTIGTARAVAGLCKEIGETPGPSNRARRYAAKRGWLPPAYFDDDLRLFAA